MSRTYDILHFKFHINVKTNDRLLFKHTSTVILYTSLLQCIYKCDDYMDKYDLQTLYSGKFYLIHKK